MTKTPPRRLDDGRNWARKILARVDAGIHVQPVALEYALEAMRGFPPEAGKGGEVIELRARRVDDDEA